jgi:hypothetical protein
MRTNQIVDPYNERALPVDGGYRTLLVVQYRRLQAEKSLLVQNEFSIARNELISSTLSRKRWVYRYGLHGVVERHHLLEILAKHRLHYNLQNKKHTTL